MNGVNLAEIDGGEVAVTNWHSCNGPEFVLQLRFVKQGTDASGISGTGLLCCNVIIFLSIAIHMVFSLDGASVTACYL